MALFGQKKEKFIELPKDADNSKLFYKVDLNNLDEKDAKITVPTTHSVLLIKDGTINAVLEEGLHDLYEKTSGFWIFKRNVKDYHTAYALFVSKTAKTTVYWGTPLNARMNYIDPKLGYPIVLAAFGNLEIRVKDAKKFYLEIVASNENDVYSKENFENRFRPKAVSIIGEIIKKKIVETGVSYFDLDGCKSDIQNKAKEALKENFEQDYGIELCDFLIEKMSIDEDEEITLKNIYKEQRRKINERIEYRENRDFEREVRADQEQDIRDAVAFKKSMLAGENAIYDDEKRKEREEIEYQLKIKREEEDRAWAREREVQQREAEANKDYLDAVKAVGWENGSNASGKAFCAKCGFEIAKDDMFCGNCGAPTKSNSLVSTCPKCGREVSIKVLYCPSCGHKMKEDAGNENGKENG